MVKRDYTKEVGIDSGPEKLSKRVMIPILAVIAIGTLLFIAGLVKGARPTAHAAKVAALAPATPALANG